MGGADTAEGGGVVPAEPPELKTWSQMAKAKAAVSLVCCQCECGRAKCLITSLTCLKSEHFPWAGGRGCGMRLELNVFLLKEFLFLSTERCPWCCQFAWTGGDEILCFGVLWYHFWGPLQGAQRGWLQCLVLSVLEGGKGKLP